MSEVYLQVGDARWKNVKAYPTPDQVTLIYEAPCCGNQFQINVQPPTDDEPTVETELWCHRDGLGCPVTLTLA